MALDVFAVPAMSDECERLFSSAKILLSDRRSRLRMDIIEASECLRAWYGPPPRKTFDDEAISAMEGEPQSQENEGGEAEDTSDSGSDTDEDEPEILNYDGVDEEITGAGAIGEGSETTVYKY